MRGEPFTPCKLRRVFGPEIPEGSFLRAKTMGYRVDRAAGATLHCTRWPLEQIPADAEVYGWSWSPRTRRAPGPRS